MKHISPGLAVFLLLFMAFSTAIAETIIIPYDKATIQEGIDISKEGDTILVAPGSKRESMR